MKKAVLRLYGAAKSPWEQAKDSSSVSSKGLVLWEGAMSRSLLNRER